MSGGSCSKGTWRQFFEATGDNFVFIELLSLKVAQYSQDKNTFVENLSRTWALPFTVLLAVVTYAVLAAVFFNMDA